MSTDDLKQRLDRLSPAKRALLERRLIEAGLKQAASSSIPRRENRELAPLSFAQERLWFLNQLEPESAAYHEPKALRLSGLLDIEALERALNAIIERHETLRTTIVMIDGRPMQRIAEHRDIEVPLIDLQPVPDNVRDTEARRLIDETICQPFDLSKDCVLRILLLRLSGQEHIFLVVKHHIASDGWSSAIFWREFQSLYTAFTSDGSAELPQLPIQYADFASWQRDWLQGETLENQLSYWRNQLNDLSALQLPIDRPRPEMLNPRGATQGFLVNNSTSNALKTLSRESGVTLFMTLLAAFQTLLCRYSNQEDIAVGSPIAGRNRIELEGLIGFFANTLVLRADLTNNPTFKAVLERVRKTCLEAYSHQDLPFEKLVEELQPERSLSQNPLFQVTFQLNSSRPKSSDLSGLRVEDFELTGRMSKFDLSLAMTDSQESISGRMIYNKDLFDAATIERMVGHFQTLLEGVVANPDQPISDLPLLTEAEKHQLLIEWNDTKTDYPKDKCIHQLFEEQVEKSPDAIAVVFEDQQVTYRELNNRANQLARYLQKLGVGPEVLVGLCLERSVDMIVALLAILKAGGAYVPLDPELPRERIAFMLQDANASMILTQKPLVSLLPAANARRIFLDEQDWQGLTPDLADQPDPTAQVSPNQAAYVIYTSGSTGQPKGVMIQHKSVVNFLASMARQPGMSAKDILLAVTTLSFDIAALEIYLPLTVGARVVVSHREIAADGMKLGQLMSDCGATVMQATPATWRMLLTGGWPGNQQLKILCGGEALSEELAMQLSPRGASLWNMYGPTETTIWSAVQKVPASVEKVALGRPIANTQIYVLDAHLNTVPIGVIGELHIGGDGLARGYLNRPELTAEKFIANPFSNEPGARLYKTGDLARYLPDGNIEFLGRIDNQVKIRGFRIELGEIEAVLAQHPSIQQTVVIAREETPGERRLVAYTVSTNGSAPSTHELRSFLQQKLPDYMVPSAFVFLDSLPLTANGKLDRKSLPAPDHSRPELEDNFVAPRTPVEEILANIWAEVLKLDKVGIHDNFFHLGGHSLLATQVVSRIRSSFSFDLPLREIFAAPTIAALAPKVQPNGENDNDVRGQKITRVARALYKA